jgi:hypothetical protein
MKLIDRPVLGALAFTLSIVVLASCSAATPTGAPSGSAPSSPASEPSSAPPSGSPSLPPSATPSPTPTPKPSPIVLAWHRSPDKATPGTGDWYGMSGQRNMTWTKVGDLFVVPIASPNDKAEVWTSRDLLHWTKAVLPVGAGESLTVKAVTRGGPGLVAYGDGSLAPDDSSITATWTSTDGVTWKRNAATGLTPGQLWLLRATGEGNVSYVSGPVDVTEFPGTPFKSPGQPALIVSQGGATAFTDQMDEVTPVEMWQAIGTDGWHKVRVLPKSSNGGHVKNAVQGPKGYFLFGCGADCTQSVGWTSADGVAWRTVLDAEFDGLNSILAVASGFIGLGERVTGLGCALSDSEIFGVTWTSLDGREWTKMKEEAQFNRASIHIAIVRTGRVYGLGIRWSTAAEGPVSTVWTAVLPADDLTTVPAPAPTPPPAHAGCGD